MKSDCKMPFTARFTMELRMELKLWTAAQTKLLSGPYLATDPYQNENPDI